MKPTWDWLLTVMDATEAQLKFGASLTNTSDTTSSPSSSTTSTTTTRSGHPLNSSSNSGGGVRLLPTTLASLGVLAFNYLHVIFFIYKVHVLLHNINLFILYYNVNLFLLI